MRDSAWVYVTAVDCEAGTATGRQGGAVLVPTGSCEPGHVAAESRRVRSAGEPDGTCMAGMAGGRCGLIGVVLYRVHI